MQDTSTKISQPDVYIVKDFIGDRRFIVPPHDPNWSHHADVSPVILKFEALTGTRAKDGMNPYKFWRIFTEWEGRNSGITFADYCRRLHPDEIDVVNIQPLTSDSSDYRPLSWFPKVIKTAMSKRARRCPEEMRRIEFENGKLGYSVRDATRWYPDCMKTHLSLLSNLGGQMTDK